MFASTANEKKHTTHYWGFRELSAAEADHVSGGDSVEECLADGDGVSECIPRVVIEGERGPIETDWAYDNFVPVRFLFASGPKTSDGLPVLTEAQRDEFCNYVANAAWKKILAEKASGAIPWPFSTKIPSEAVSKQIAKQVCLDGLRAAGGIST